MRILQLILAALLLPASALAQAGNPAATLRGSVADPNGAPVHSAAVTLEPSHQSAAVDADGRFTLANVAPGTYTLSITAPGFQPTASPVNVTNASPQDLPAIVLRLATVTAGVDVTAPLSQTEIATAQIHDEERQRLLGVLPNFFVTYDPKPVPLTTRQKFALSFRTVIDPSSFIVSGIVAGAEQATETFPGYGYGFSGYAKRYGSAYGGEVVGIMVSAAIVPSILHQDPRYFYKGTGSVKSRIGYALATPFRIKGDNGKWQPNYSDFAGTLAATSIANTWLPAADRSSGTDLVTSALINTASEAVAAIIQEFVFSKATTGKKGKRAKSPANATP